MVGLPGCMAVEGLVVDYTARFTVSLGGDDHPGDPARRFIQRNRLQDSKAYVSVQATTHSLLPVQRDLCWGVDSSGGSLRFDMEA